MVLMKLKCPSCKNNFDVSEISTKEFTLSGPQFECPACNAWVKKNPKLYPIQILGGLMIFFGLYIKYSSGSFYNVSGQYIFIFGGVLTVATFFFAKLVPATRKRS